MADKKISALTGATTPLAGTEVLPIVQSGTTVKVSVANLTAGRAMSASSVNISGLTASTALALDASKEVVSVTNTGTGDNVLATSPTLATPILGVASATSITTDTYKAASSSGGALQNSGGTPQLQWGAGGGNNLSVDVAININPANAAVAISPTGTGTVAISPAGALTINPTAASTINNTSIGATTASTGRFTSITATTGNVVIGTSGQGIDFSATPNTGTSELLSDYEEGTWTPSLGGTTTYLAQVGTYTKIGRLVYVAGTIYVNVIGTGSTTTISGLPFGATSGQAQGVSYSDIATSVVQLVPEISFGDVIVKGAAAAGVSNRASITVFGNGTFFAFTAIYEV